MEFWGVEVKAGVPLKVAPKDESLIHVSQAALGESKKDKGNEPVHIFVNIDGKKIVLGTMSSQNIPQISFDLVFEKEFQLSHNWKHGSVYFCGYQSPIPEEGFSDLGEESSEDEEMPDFPMVDAENGEVKAANAKSLPAKANTGKPESQAKPKVKLVEPSKDNKAEDDVDEDDESDDDNDDETDEDAESDKADSEEGDSDEDSDDDESESEDEETPKKAEPSKKRPTDSAAKTPVSSKKVKLNTPQKTDGKKAVHTATPHPAKQGGKKPANDGKLQTPKSGSNFTCIPCSRSFTSDAALQSHSKAKHGGK